MPDPLTSAVAADQAAAHAAESRHHHGPSHTHCENCGTELKGPYCYVCGQHDFEFHRSFWHVFLEALENFLHFDAKFFRNIVTLLFQPGRLTAEFNAGKRAAQMPPFRLYVFVSFLFFFLSFLGGDKTPVLAHDNAPAGQKLPQQGRADLARELEESARTMPPGTEREKMETAARQLREGRPAEEIAAEALKLLPAAKHPRQKVEMPGDFALSLKEGEQSSFERYLTERGRYAFAHPHELKEAVLHAVPKMMLVCLPIFALYTRFLFRKSGQVYLQHLVLALHFHTFIYLFLLIRSGWVGLGDLVHLGGWISFAAGVWLTLYPFLMFRRLFGTSWKGTIVRTLTLAFAYGLTQAVVFLGTIVVIFVLL